jgi:hypothetical protein
MQLNSAQTMFQGRSVQSPHVRICFYISDDIANVERTNRALEAIDRCLNEVLTSP